MKLRKGFDPAKFCLSNTKLQLSQPKELVMRGVNLIADDGKE